MDLISTCVPNIGELEEEFVARAVRSTFVSSVGPFVDEFEKLLAQEGQFSASTVVSSGTVALKLALETLGVKRDDLVIVPSLSFIATANSVSHAGAQPWFVDVSSDSWTIDLNTVRQCLETCSINAAGDLIEPNSGKPNTRCSGRTTSMV